MVSTPSWKYDMLKGPVFSLLILIPGNFGRWRKNQIKSVLVQDTHGLRAGTVWRGAETAVLGAGIPASLITD